MSWTLVTGGAKGLGAEICRTLASEGRSIIVHYNKSHKEAEEVAKQCRTFNVKAETVQGDFSTRLGTEAFVTRYLSRFSDTQFLVNNVGNFLVKNASETSAEEWEQLFQSNVFSAITLIKGVSDSIKSNKGSIVNIGVAGLGNTDSYSTAYSAAKLSLLMHTKSLARELAPFQVSVNMVSPGYLENSTVMPPQLPMDRPARLSEAAHLVAFLLKPQSRYITGQNIEIAGGVRL